MIAASGQGLARMFKNLIGSGLRRALVCGALVLGAGAGLVACGGGSAIQPFKPTRLFVLGDEQSLLLRDGRKYTVNALSADGASLDCATNPLWIQVVATAFSLTFEQCNPNASANLAARSYAEPGAKSAGASAQLDRVMADGPLAGKQLALIYFGHNDMLELYGQYPGRTRDDLISEARSRGVALAQVVNRVAQSGPAVILVTAPDLGLSPFGRAQTAANPSEISPTRAQVLSQLTDSFNAGLRVTILNDGRLIGLVSADQMVRDVQPPLTSYYGFINVTDPVCRSDVVLPACDSSTLITDGTPLTYGYADDRLFSPGFQNRLGQLAASRALRNPF